MPVSAFFPSAAAQNDPDSTNPHTSNETCSNNGLASSAEGNNTTSHALEQRLRSISAAQSLATRGWRFPSSRRYLWDRTATGACLSIEIKDIVPAVEIPHNFFAGQRWLTTRKPADHGFCHNAVVKYASRGQNGVKIVLEQEDVLNPLAPKSGHESFERTTITCLIFEGPILGKGGLVDTLQSCTLALDQKGPASLSQLLPMVCALENASSTSVGLHGVVMVPNATFGFTPLLPKRMCDVPLTRILQQPINLSIVGTPSGLAAQNGLLTMDQARSVMPLTPDDPQAYSVPLVGIWVKNAPSVQHPIVAACCFRFRYCSTFTDRAMQAGGAFLVALFTEVSASPEYYECEIREGSTGLQMLPCTFNLTKAMPPQPGPGPDIVTPVPDAALTPIKFLTPPASSVTSSTYSYQSSIPSRTASGVNSSASSGMSASSAYTLPSRYYQTQPSSVQIQQPSPSIASLSKPQIPSMMPQAQPPASVNSTSNATSTCALPDACKPLGKDAALDGFAPHATMVHCDMSSSTSIDRTHLQVATKPQTFSHSGQPQVQPPAMRLEAPGGAAVSLVMPAGLPSWSVTAQVHTTLTSTAASPGSSGKDAGAGAGPQQVQTTQQFTWMGGNLAPGAAPIVHSKEPCHSKDPGCSAKTANSSGIDAAVHDAVKTQGGIMASLSKDAHGSDTRSCKDISGGLDSSIGKLSECTSSAYMMPDNLKDGMRPMPAIKGASAVPVLHQQQPTFHHTRHGTSDTDRPGLTPEAKELQGQIQELRRQVQELQQQVAAVAASGSSNPPSVSQSLESPMQAFSSWNASQQHNQLLGQSGDGNLPLISHTSAQMLPSQNMHRTSHHADLLHATHGVPSWATSSITSAPNALAGSHSRPTTPQQQTNSLALPPSYNFDPHSQMSAPALLAQTPGLQQYNRLSTCGQFSQYNTPDYYMSRLTQSPVTPTSIHNSALPPLPQVQTPHYTPSHTAPWSSSTLQYTAANLPPTPMSNPQHHSLVLPSSLPMSSPFTTNTSILHTPSQYHTPPTPSRPGLPLLTPTYNPSSVTTTPQPAPYPASPRVPSTLHRHTHQPLPLPLSQDFTASMHRTSSIASSISQLQQQQQQLGLPPAPQYYTPSTPRAQNTLQHPATPSNSLAHTSAASSYMTPASHTLPLPSPQLPSYNQSSQPWATSQPSNFQPTSLPLTQYTQPATPQLAPPNQFSQALPHPSHMPQPTIDISSSWSASNRCSPPDMSQAPSAASTPREPQLTHSTSSAHLQHGPSIPMPEPNWHTTTASAPNTMGSYTASTPRGITHYTSGNSHVAPLIRSDSPKITHSHREQQQYSHESTAHGYSVPTASTCNPQPQFPPQLYSPHMAQTPALVPATALHSNHSASLAASSSPQHAHSMPQQTVPHSAVSHNPHPYTNVANDQLHNASVKNVEVSVKAPSSRDSRMDDVVRTSSSSSLSSIPPTPAKLEYQPGQSAIARCRDLQSSFASSESSYRYDDDDGLSLGSLSARGVKTHLGLSGITVHDVSHAPELPSGAMDIVRTKYIPISDDSDSDSEEDARLMAKYGLRH